MEKEIIEIATLKTEVKNIKEKIDRYETNHFPSLEKRLDRIENKIAYSSGGLAALILLIGLVLKLI